MTSNRKEILIKIASVPKGAKRAVLLKDDALRQVVLSSGANVTLYSGKPQTAKTAEEALSSVYIGLIQRKNKKGRLDGLGALGGLAERTDEEFFNRLDDKKKTQLIGQKDDVILENGHPVLTKDINIIRKNNVIREMREELDDLGIKDIHIKPENLELIPMPHVKDDNYMINIWNGEGECFAISPFCHIYEDKKGLIDEISRRASEKEGGEATAYKKIPLFEALSAYGNKGQGDIVLEDGRSADKDYRYPHEYLASWALAAKLFKYNEERLVILAKEVQEKADNFISFKKVAEDTGQKMEDIAEILHIKPETLLKIEQQNKKIFALKSPNCRFNREKEE